jgi:hypothetical protein
MAWSHVESEGREPLSGQFMLSLCRSQFSQLFYFIEEGYMSSNLDYSGPMLYPPQVTTAHLFG